jgi:hypothetical protein
MKTRTVTIQNITKLGAAATAATLIALMLSACQATHAVETFVSGEPCRDGPTVWLVPDVSGSTAALRKPGGLYTRAVETVITKTAESCGALYAGAVAGNGINTDWMIDGSEFRHTIGGNAELGAAARAQKAKQELFPKVRALLTTKDTQGSDFLGVMRRVSEAADSLPKDQHKRLTLILVFDGVLYLPGHYSLYKTPINTPARRKKFIARLKRGDDIPKLNGFDVYLAGLGVGVSNREIAKAVIRFWKELVPLTGAKLRSTDASLRFP